MAHIKASITIVSVLLYTSSTMAMHRKKCIPLHRKKTTQDKLHEAIRSSKAHKIPDLLLLGATTKSKKKL